MKPAATRVVLCLAIACSIMAMGHAACCGYGTAGIYASPPSLSYSQYRETDTPSLYGYLSVPYTSSCGDCITASFNLNNPDKSCTYQGSLPGISGYRCKYALSYINEYAASKLKRSNVPCSYSSYVSTNLNATHYQTCSTSYMGTAAVEFDLTGPKGGAKVDCSKLFAGPSNCNINSI